jgi:hypothetical protein
LGERTKLPGSVISGFFLASLIDSPSASAAQSRYVRAEHFHGIFRPITSEKPEKALDNLYVM